MQELMSIFPESPESQEHDKDRIMNEILIAPGITMIFFENYAIRVKSAVSASSVKRTISQSDE